MIDEEYVKSIIETLRLIKSRYKMLGLIELKRVRQYVNATWSYLYPSHEEGGYKDDAVREALQLVIDLQMELKVELDARRAAIAAATA
jgi:hypothetical protein